MAKEYELRVRDLMAICFTLKSNSAYVEAHFKTS